MEEEEEEEKKIPATLGTGDKLEAMEQLSQNNTKQYVYNRRKYSFSQWNQLYAECVGPGSVTMSKNIIDVLYTTRVAHS